MQNTIILKIDEKEATKRPVDLINYFMYISSETNTLKCVSGVLKYKGKCCLIKKGGIKAKDILYQTSLGVLCSY